MQEPKFKDVIEEFEFRINNLERKITSYEVEKQAFSHMNSSEVKQKLADIATNQFELIRYRIEKCLYPIIMEVDEEVKFEIKDKCLYALLGFKFVEGNGWGQYGVYRGTDRIREFSRYENGVESNVVLGGGYVIYYPQDIMKINQNYGKGSQKIELVGISMIDSKTNYRLPFKKQR